MNKINPNCPRCGQPISEHEFEDEGSSMFPCYVYVRKHYITRNVETDSISKALSTHPFAQKYMPQEMVNRMSGNATEEVAIYDCRISEIEIYQGLFGKLVK